MARDLDPQLTFDTFVVGSGNRLAYAAARRVAEAPGSTYNPLFVYSASGLGKTHLLMAIGHQVESLYPGHEILYETIEDLVERLAVEIAGGGSERLGDQLGNTLLLVDDVQFLAGQHRAQEELLRTWDHLVDAGGQVVLTSDRPPPEIDALDDRLLSRFSGGLIMDIAAPDYETRVAIVHRKAEAHAQRLAEGVAEAIARTAFGNVRELQGGLNRVIAVQELESREVAAAEVPDLLSGTGAPRARPSEFDSFLADLTETVTEVVSELPAERQLTDAIQRWRQENYQTRRLDDALERGETDDAERLVRGFEKDVERLREISGQIATLDPQAQELSRLEVLRDPDQLRDADALLAAVRARTRPLPGPPAGPEPDVLPSADGSLAGRAAEAIIAEPAKRYNPLYLHGSDGDRRGRLMASLARRLADAQPDMQVGYISGDAFAAELITALEQNQVDVWRSRWRRASALFLDGVDALGETERAQEELFHLFDTLLGSGAQLVFGAKLPPTELRGVEDRLRSRLASGLVAEIGVPARVEEGDALEAGEAVEVGEAMEPGVAGQARDAAEAVQEGGPGEIEGDADHAEGLPRTRAASDAEGRAPGNGDRVDEQLAVRAEAAQSHGFHSGAAPITGGRDDWFRSTEKVVWTWPYVSDWLTEEL